MIRFVKVLLLLFTFFLISCGNDNLLMSLSKSENSVTFRTSIESGDILDPDSGEPIHISIEYDESIVRPARLEIVFLDAQGLEISEPQIIEGAKLNEPLPAIAVSSPDENLYSIRLRVFDSDDALIKEEIISFFYSKDSFLIRGIVAYPNTFIPGGLGLIFPDAEASDSSWIRWSIDNEIIEEGFLSQYRNGFIWRAPSVEGVYGLRMEIFPVEPLYTANGTFSFTSPYRSDIEIFVTKTTTSDPVNLYPYESYSTLIHFNGILEDQGSLPGEVVPVGSPVISRQGDKFGFYLSRDSGYLIDKNVLPVVAGVLMPFSVTFLYYFNGPQLDSSFLTITGDESEFFSIKTDFSGVLTAKLSQFGADAGITNVSGLYPEEYTELTLSVVPSAGSVSFYWYGDGVMISSGSSHYNGSVPDVNYKSLIGADNGFDGLLDEFGIYYRDEQGRNNIDDNIFEREVNRKYNSDKIITAYGFDGLYLDNVNGSSFSVLSGSLHLDSKSEFQFLETDFNFSYLFIDFDFEQIIHGSELQIHLTEGSEEKIIHINLEELSWAPGNSENLKIELTIDNSILKISHYGNIIAETKVQMKSSVVFYVVNNSEYETVKIASLLVRREEKRVVEKIIGSSESKL